MTVVANPNSFNLGRSFGSSKISQIRSSANVEVYKNSKESTRMIKNGLEITVITRSGEAKKAEITGSRVFFPIEESDGVQFSQEGMRLPINLDSLDPAQPDDLFTNAKITGDRIIFPIGIDNTSTANHISSGEIKNIAAMIIDQSGIVIPKQDPVTQVWSYDTITTDGVSFNAGTTFFNETGAQVSVGNSFTTDGVVTLANGSSAGGLTIDASGIFLGTENHFKPDHVQIGGTLGVRIDAGTVYIGATSYFQDELVQLDENNTFAPNNVVLGGASGVRITNTRVSIGASTYFENGRVQLDANNTFTTNNVVLGGASGVRINNSSVYISNNVSIRSDGYLRINENVNTSSFSYFGTITQIGGTTGVRIGNGVITIANSTVSTVYNTAIDGLYIGDNNHFRANDVQLGGSTGVRISNNTVSIGTETYFNSETVQLGAFMTINGDGIYITPSLGGSATIHPQRLSANTSPAFEVEYGGNYVRIFRERINLSMGTQIGGGNGCYVKQAVLKINESLSKMRSQIADLTNVIADIDSRLATITSNQNAIKSGTCKAMRQGYRHIRKNVMDKVGQAYRSTLRDAPATDSFANWAGFNDVAPTGEDANGSDGFVAGSVNVSGGDLAGAALANITAAVTSAPADLGLTFT